MNIQFMKVWNKLHYPIFTTVRLYTKQKFEFYKNNSNLEFDITVGTENVCKARLVAVSIKRMKEILYPEFTRADADCEPEAFYDLMSRMYKDKYKGLWRDKETLVLILFLCKK